MLFCSLPQAHSPCGCPCATNSTAVLHRATTAVFMSYVERMEARQEVAYKCWARLVCWSAASEQSI